MTKDIERERKAFEERFQHLDLDFVDDLGYCESETQTAWASWQAAKAHEAKKIEGCVVVPVDQAKDTERLDFMLDGGRLVKTNDIRNDDYEVIAEGFCVNEVYWIDGFDRLTETVHQTKREAIDAAIQEQVMLEAARGGNE